MIVVENGAAIAEVIGVPDRAERLAYALAKLAAVTGEGALFDRYRASWQRVIDALTGEDERELVAGMWIDDGSLVTMQAAKLKADAQAQILAIYPYHKQLNLMADGGPEFEAMRAEIDAIRADCNAKIGAL